MANGRNGLDVDKFDYLQRDSLYCNVKINADFDRLQKLSKVALALGSPSSLSKCVRYFFEHAIWSKED